MALTKETIRTVSEVVGIVGVLAGLIYGYDQHQKFVDGERDRGEEQRRVAALELLQRSKSREFVSAMINVDRTLSSISNGSKSELLASTEFLTDFGVVRGYFTFCAVMYFQDELDKCTFSKHAHPDFGSYSKILNDINRIDPTHKLVSIADHDVQYYSEFHAQLARQSVCGDDDAESARGDFEPISL